MIVFLTVIYVVLLLLAFKFKVVQPTLFWKLSPILWMVLLLVGLFIPMQFWAPQGPLVVGQYSVQIVPNVQGEVIEVNAKPNVPMKQGDVLFRIDPTPYEAAVQQTRAQLDLARTRLSQSKRLAERAAGSVYDVQQFTAQVEQLEGALKNAEFNLEETTVRAPADGYVTNVALRPGARVVNLPLVQAMAFVETGDLLVGAEIAQGHLRYLEPGQPAEIAFKIYPGRVYDAEVDYVLPASAVGQFGLSGFAAAPKEIPHAPFWVRLKLSEEAGALDLPVGATGAVAIYTQKGKMTHVIRKVVIRVEAIKNYIIPN
jgi:multidrug resistance efflux pump